MIDKDKVKAFWDARAATYERLNFDSIANLEQDPENLALKTRLESEKVFQYLGDLHGKTILDLGAGVGQWAFRFIDRGAASVTAVEYSAALASVGRTEATRRGITNVDFVVSAAEDFLTPTQFDIVFISGLFVYMNDDQSTRFMLNLPTFCRGSTSVLLRDGTGIEGRHEINDKLSGHLGVRYSATYRTADDYLRMFDAAGFACVKHENMFTDECVLNKYRETRLRIYLFQGSGHAKG
jgi:SAM-dependent methyltransferase